MTPAKFKSLLKGKLIVDNIDVQCVPNTYKMAVFNQYKKDKDTYFEPATRWYQCRELVSRALSPGTNYFRKQVYVPNTNATYSWEWNLKVNTTRLSYDEVAGNLLILGISGISQSQANSMLKVLNLAEEFNPYPGKTELLKTTYKMNALTFSSSHKRKASSGRLYLFVVPNCWKISMPHISFLTLLMRLAYRKPIKDESLDEYIARVRVGGGDSAILDKLLKREPNLIKILVRHWAPLKKTVKRWNNLSYQNGIDRITLQAKSTKKGNIPKTHRPLADKLEELMEKYRCGC